MVVPMGLRVEGSDNNDHAGIFPGSLGSVLHHLEHNHTSTTTEKMASRSQQQLPFSKNHAPDHFLRHQQHLPLSSWSFSPSLLDKSKELEQQQQQELHLVSSNTASPRSCFFQFQPQQQQQQQNSLLNFSPLPPPLQQQQPFSHQKSTDHVRRAAGSSKKARSSSSSETPTAEPPRAATKDPSLSSSCRRDDSSSLSSSISRGGKMTSLGASPKCNVCSHKPNEARVITFCGHLLCWPCLCCWLHNKSPNKECPVCNRPLTKNHITPLHGRQNSLTVARLQGMLRPEKTTSTPRVHSRGGGGGDGAWSRRHQSRISTATTAVAAPATSKSARSIIFDGAPKINASIAEDDCSNSTVMRILTRQSSSNFFRPALAAPAATMAGAGSEAAAVEAVAEVNTWNRSGEENSSFDRDPPLVAAFMSSSGAMELVSSPTVDHVELDHYQQEQYQLGSASSLYGAISTASTVVTTDACCDDTSLSPIISPPPAGEGFGEVAGHEEIRELGVLLSLEWEGAMSAIENAWWDAVSEVLNAGGNTAEEMKSVERLSREKETIIHELASEPLKGLNWLALRLDSFKMIASEELDNRTPVPQEFTPMEIDDWFLDSPDEGQALFPEFPEQDQADEADGEAVAELS